ncbi:MAG: hypothetical protein HKN87_09690 [Saprospiraceae bacterium]|nr:hypothetical protein [Saprospiraceae bacterium]
MTSILPAAAQWNVIAGYDISGLRNTQMNGIINDYNLKQTSSYLEMNQVSLAFKQVKVLHGFVAGFRYGYDWGGLEMTFSRRSTRRIGDDYNVVLEVDEESEVTDTIIGMTFLKPTNFGDANIDLHYHIKTISLTKEFGGAIRIGGAIDYNIYTYEVIYKDPPITNRLKKNQYIWGSKVFVGAHLTNSTKMSFSVRAYYQWIWGDNSLSEFETDFDKTKAACTYCTERPHSIGLSIIINNGLQP